MVALCDIEIRIADGITWGWQPCLSAWLGPIIGVAP